MKSTLYTGGAIVAFAGSLLAASPALAAGTQAGNTITNEVTVSYSVGGEPQDDIDATDTVTVDRKINLSVARVDNTATVVVPGADQQAVFFTVENTSNDTLDFQLDADNVTNGNAAGITGTDAFDAEGGFTYYLDNGDTAGVFDANDTLITHLDALAPDTPTTVIVVSNIPTSATNGQIAAINLAVTARENDGAATLGATIIESATNTAGEDTIFADTGRDGVEDATDDYIVATAEITVAKTSKVVASPVTGDTSGTYIPGATVEYCILVTNNSATVGATGVSISDNISALDLTFVNAALGTTGNAVAVGGADCDTYGTTAGSESSGVVTGTIGSLAAGSAASVIFRATID